MKILHLLLVIVLVSSCTANELTTILLENTSAETRIDEGISISREQISAWTKVCDTLFPVLINPGGSYIPSQADDLDGDGCWDELFLVTDLAGNEVREFKLDFLNEAQYPETPVRTNIRFASIKDGYKEHDTGIRETHAINTITATIWQMEGIGWENDYVGFRNYFDQRNGMDIFGKVTNRMILDKVGTPGFPGYHDFNQDWGCDVLKVGESLGAGSIAYLYNDSLYRVGDNGVGSCEILIEGPLRSIFRFRFEDWKLGDINFDVVNDISIQAGKFFYESKVTYTGIDESLELVSGIVNMKSQALHEVENINNYKAYYTLDIQSEDTTILGMAILVPEINFSRQTETSKTGSGIIETYCIHQTASPGETLKYRFYSVWERQNEKWTDPEEFEQLIRKDAEFLNNPVKVSIK